MQQLSMLCGGKKVHWNLNTEDGNVHAIKCAKIELNENL